MSFADVVGSSSSSSSSPPPPPPSATAAIKLKLRAAGLGAPGGAVGRSVVDSSNSSISHRSDINSKNASFDNARLGVVGVGGRGGGRGEWVSTGDAVREQYKQAREEAGELAR